MYQGIVRDEERRRAKREQREKDLQESLQRRAEYEAVQKVHKVDYDNQ
jgi:protein PET117